MNKKINGKKRKNISILKIIIKINKNKIIILIYS